jgi:hypothetical protein
MEVAAMHTHFTPTTKTLPSLLAQLARVLELCHECGKIGQVYADDHITLLCAKCWLKLHGDQDGRRA